MFIEKSTDWCQTEITLLARTRKLTHSAELSKMIKNLNAKVTALSKQEVKSRQNPGYHIGHLVEDINKDILLIEEYMLIANLLG
jgi:ATP-dependent 26S proteasome regulatory subunit